jgi:hypothetical protein
MHLKATDKGKALPFSLIFFIVYMVTFSFTPFKVIDKLSSLTGKGMIIGSKAYVFTEA